MNVAFPLLYAWLYGKVGGRQALWAVMFFSAVLPEILHRTLSDKDLELPDVK